jgi:hypothetical protein
MSYLLAYDLGSGKNAFTDVYTAADLSGNVPYKVSDTVEAGYVDISSIENWWWFYTQNKEQNCRLINKDYKFVRNEIIMATYIIGWANLSDNEKFLAASTFSVDKPCRDEIFTFQEQLQWGLVHHKRSKEARLIRANIAQVEVFNRIDKIYWPQLENDLVLTSGNLINLYTENGREGTLEGDAEGVFDYIDGSNRTGTTWSNALIERGFRDKQFPVVGFPSCSEFADELLKILKDGDYGSFYFELY